MKSWHIPSIAGSTDKRVERQEGANSPRVPSAGPNKPRVLFSSSECRIIVLDVCAGEEIGDHRVHERAVIQVVSGRISITTNHETLMLETGALVIFEPAEHHSVLGIEDARLVLILAPWPGQSLGPMASDPEHVPANATISPDTPTIPASVRPPISGE